MNLNTKPGGWIKHYGSFNVKAFHTKGGALNLASPSLSLTGLSSRSEHRIVRSSVKSQKSGFINITRTFVPWSMHAKVNMLSNFFV